MAELCQAGPLAGSEHPWGHGPARPTWVLADLLARLGDPCAEPGPYRIA
jgi:hypothetical protein